MKRTSGKIFIFVVAFAMVTMSCLCLPSSLTEKFLPGNSNQSEQYLGETFRSEEGGFSIRKITGLGFEESFGIVNMAAADAVTEVGPAVMVFGGINDDEKSAQDLMDTMQAESPTMQLSKPKEIKVGGFSGLSANISGSYNDNEIDGRIVVVMVTPTQQFTYLGMAPKDRWEELEPMYEAGLSSVELFEIDPNAALGSSGSTGPETSNPQPPVTSEPSTAQTGTSEALIRQWAVNAQASSEYGSVDWGAVQAIGEPDVNECVDDVHAWASLSAYTEEWLMLDYAQPVFPVEINIYQSYNPSQVVEVHVVDLEGYDYMVWQGVPEMVDYCPDLMTITLDLEEQILVNQVVVVVDQSVLGVGWVEIDAVELVGYAQNGQVQTNQPETTSDSPVNPATNGTVPDNYSGWMAGSVYQGYLRVIPGMTTVSELDGLMGLTGRKSTENWKPRDDHADTFIYELGQDDLLAYISVTTSGEVYKKSISPSKYPSDYAVDTVTKSTYDELNDIYKRDFVIPYEVMANIMGNPGFLSEQYKRQDDGKMVSTYIWLHANGDKMVGIFYDGKLTGIAGLAFIPKE